MKTRRPLPTIDRAALRARREALRARMQKRRPTKKRRRPYWLLGLLLLLLVLACMCCCSGDPEPEVPEMPAGPVAAGEPAPPPPPPPVELTGRIDRKPRPAYQGKPAAALPWLASFKLQVAARSPRLSKCFEGVARPGSLKWTAEVEPVSGRVSEHTIEPTLLSETLTSAQRACVLGVLSEPAYHLEVDERTTPSRVGMAIEF